MGFCSNSRILFASHSDTAPTSTNPNTTIAAQVMIRLNFICKPPYGLQVWQSAALREADELASCESSPLYKEARRESPCSRRRHFLVPPSFPRKRESENETRMNRSAFARIPYIRKRGGEARISPKTRARKSRESRFRQTPFLI